LFKPFFYNFMTGHKWICSAGALGLSSDRRLSEPFAQQT
jgi:hypothetical protein